VAENQGNGESPTGSPTTPTDPLLEANAILEAWRVCYLANFYVFPLFRRLERQWGITRPEWVILFCLAHQEPLCAQDIVAKTWQPKNSINRGVKLLSGKGLIKRREDPEDGRRILLSLTQAGWKTYSQTLPLAVSRKEWLVASLSGEEQQTLNRLLSKMCAHVQGRDSDFWSGD
jgi:DNA-binding MarR family transcriptional regulator